MSRRVRFDVSPELVLGVLGLPADVDIISVGVDGSGEAPIVRFHVVGPDFDDVPEGDESPVVWPAVRLVDGRPVFSGWGR